jgi:hypothetical protein
MTTIPFNLDGIDDVDMTPRNTIITDEMVEKAYNIWLSHVDAKKSLRAALEAVEPMLIAQGMREAAGMLSALLRVTPQERQDPAIWFPLVDAARAAIKFVPINRCDNCDNGVEPEWPFCAWCGVAQELDPK